MKEIPKGTLMIPDGTHTILKCLKGGMEDKKAKPVEALLAICQEKGEMVAEAFEKDGYGQRVLPELHHFWIMGWYGNGFRLAGYSHEVVGHHLRRCYCEWFIFHDRNTEKRLK